MPRLIPSSDIFNHESAGPADVGVLQAVFRHGGNSGKRYTLRFASTMNSTVPSLVLPDSIEGPLNNHDAGGSTAG